MPRSYTTPWGTIHVLQLSGGRIFLVHPNEQTVRSDLCRVTAGFMALGFKSVVEHVSC